MTSVGGYMLGLRILEGVIIVQAQACNLDFSDALGQPTPRSTKTQYILKIFRASRNTTPGFIVVELFTLVVQK